MSKKKLKITGTLIAFLLCFPLHSVYDKFPNFFTSILSPVNESIWEHMKILFTSILLSGILQKLYVKKEKLNYNNICLSNFIGALLSIPIFLIIFLPIYAIIGENFLVAVIIMLITIIVSEIIAYIIMNKKEYKLEKSTIIFVIIIYILFALLTYNPLDSYIFKDPKTNTYGITK